MWLDLELTGNNMVFPHVNHYAMSTSIPDAMAQSAGDVQYTNCMSTEG